MPLKKKIILFLASVRQCRKAMANYEKSHVFSLETAWKKSILFLNKSH